METYNKAYRSAVNRNLRLVRRTIAACLALLVVAAFAVAYQQASSARAADAWSPLTGTVHDAPLRFPFTAHDAARFPGCVKALPSGSIASAFVVEREDGRMQRLPFDTVWKWTHSTTGPQVWVRGQCA